MVDIPEFVDTYSDDPIFLMRAREALFTHPLKGGTFLDDASTCRLFLYVAIGAIEAVVNDILEKKQNTLLKGYFKGNNEDQVNELNKFLLSLGITCDQRALDDLRIMRLLRNEITHSSHKEERRAKIKAAGFPADTRELTAEHLARSQAAHEHIVSALCIARSRVENPPEKAYTLAYNKRPCPPPSGTITFERFSLLPWKYLERISDELSETIDRAASEGAFHWTKGEDIKQLESRSRSELKEQFYLEALKASVAGCERFEEKVTLARDTLRFWDCYLGLHLGQLPPETEHIRKCIVWLAELSKLGSRLPPLNWQGLSEKAWQEICKHLPHINGVSNEDAAKALEWGSNSYRLIPNITAICLFCALCPVVDPANARSYIKRAYHALDLFELRWQWYGLIEHGRILESGNLMIYRNILSGIEKYVANHPV